MAVGKIAFLSANAALKKGAKYGGGDRGERVLAIYPNAHRGTRAVDVKRKAGRLRKPTKKLVTLPTRAADRPTGLCSTLRCLCSAILFVYFIVLNVCKFQCVASLCRFIRKSSGYQLKKKKYLIKIGLISY